MTSDVEEMHRIIKCWAVADQRAPVKHLVAFKTLGLNTFCGRPSQEQAKRAWHQLSRRLHPDRHAAHDELATHAMAWELAMRKGKLLLALKALLRALAIKADDAATHVRVVRFLHTCASATMHCSRRR